MCFLLIWRTDRTMRAPLVKRINCLSALREPNCRSSKRKRLRLPPRKRRSSRKTGAVQEAAAYTKDTPVEEILKAMSLEQAQQVVVDSGVCRGMTIAEVAKKRPVNLRFYLTPGNKSKDNIVRAAAQLVLDSLQKAS